jgi:DNA-binding transcriptional regulator GbsR (MarR family)
MTLNLNVEKLPRTVLEKAVKLSDPLKKIYLTLYFCEEPTTPKEIAKKLGYARAYVHMRLCQLESMDLVRRVEDKRKVRFEAL